MSPGVVRGGGAGGEGPEALAQTLLTRAKVSQHLRMGQNRKRVMVGVHLDWLLSFKTQHRANGSFLIAAEMLMRMFLNVQICIRQYVYT